MTCWVKDERKSFIQLFILVQRLLQTCMRNPVKRVGETRVIVSIRKFWFIPREWSLMDWMCWVSLDLFSLSQVNQSVRMLRWIVAEGRSHARRVYTTEKWDLQIAWWRGAITFLKNRSNKCWLQSVLNLSKINRYLEETGKTLSHVSKGELGFWSGPEALCGLSSCKSFCKPFTVTLIRFIEGVLLRRRAWRVMYSSVKTEENCLLRITACSCALTYVMPSYFCLDIQKLSVFLDLMSCQNSFVFWFPSANIHVPLAWADQKDCCECLLVPGPVFRVSCSHDLFEASLIQPSKFLHLY